MDNSSTTCGTKPPKTANHQSVNRHEKTTSSQVCVDRHVRASPETLKALKKLRKKVKQCTKIQEKLDQGLRVEVNEVQKLNQLNDFKQQIAVLETQVSSGKAMDNQGFQKVQQRRR